MFPNREILPEHLCLPALEPPWQLHLASFLLQDYWSWDFVTPPQGSLALLYNGPWEDLTAGLFSRNQMKFLLNSLLSSSLCLQ